MSCPYCGERMQPCCDKMKYIQEIHELRGQVVRLTADLVEANTEIERLQDVEGLGDGEMTWKEKAESYRKELNQRCGGMVVSGRTSGRYGLRWIILIKPETPVDSNCRDTCPHKNCKACGKRVTVTRRMADIPLALSPLAMSLYYLQRTGDWPSEEMEEHF